MVWTKWGEDVQLEEPINQLPRAVCLDKYHLLLNSREKLVISQEPADSLYYARAFVSFDIPNPMCLRAMVIFSALNLIRTMAEAFEALG